MRNYYFTSVWVSVSGSGADSVLCSLFAVLYFRLEIIFLFRVLGFRFCLCAFFFFRVLHVYFRVFECLFCYYGHQGKLSVFLKLYNDSILNFVILVLVLPFRNLCFCFGFWFSLLGFVVCIFLIGHHIFDRRLAANLSTRGNLTRLSISWQSSQIGKRLNYLRI